MAVSKKAKIDTLIISDIHLGSELSRVEKLLEVLNSYNFHRLVLNGDIFEDLNFKRLNRHHWKILSYIRQTSQKSKVIWINGNHDGAAYMLSRLMGVKVCTKYIWQYQGKRFLAIHGHQFDRLLYQNALVSNLVVALYYGVQRWTGHSNTLSKIARRMSKGWLRLSEEVAKRAFIYAAIKKVDVIFCGHTHIPLVREKGGIRYFNSGSWIETSSSYVTIVGDRVDLVMVE